MKDILIATPCLYGKVDAYYVHSLNESIKLGLKKNINLKAIFLANESILTIARNELINLAYNGNYESMVFIDDDELWEPDSLLEIIESVKDVVALPVVNKGDERLEYNVNFRITENYMDNLDRYIKVKSVGTGFLKLSRKVIVDLCESNPIISFRGKQLYNVFEFGYSNSSFIGEDILLCKKITELGHTIWVNPKYTVSHMGTKMYQGNFAKSNNIIV